MTMTALASGASNNCLLHCFAHTLFNLPEDKYAAVVGTEGYKNLLVAFGQYYGVETPSRENIDALNKDYTHPLERELIWGPVFRQMLIAKLEEKEDKTEDEQAEIVNLREENGIQDTDFAKIAGQFGVTMSIHSDQQSDIEIDPMEPNKKICTFDVIHNVLESGHNHYNFKFVDDERDNIARNHNQHFKLKSNDLGLLNYSETKLEYIAEIDIPKERVILMKALLQGHQALKKLQEEEVQEAEDNQINMGVVIEEYVADERDVTKFSAKANPKQGNDEEPKKEIALDLLTGFPLEFVQQLDIIFPRAGNWSLEKKMGKIGIEGNEQVIEIKQEDYRVSFSGTSNSFEKMIEAANAYGKSLGADAGVEYELETSSEEQALAFLKEMKGDVDMTLVTTIKIGDKTLNKVGIAELMLKVPSVIEEEDVERSVKKPAKKMG